MKTTLAKPADTKPEWFVVDADGETLGRLSVRIANVLRGRHKPTYTPHVDTGDGVIVINAEKVRVSGRKEDQKTYMFHSGYFGNEKYVTLSEFRGRRPDFIIEHAVKGMLPRNKLARHMIRKLKIYAGSEHPHAAQEPKPLPA
ncbi:MAG: 50S ribosomal protein L13 [Opitutales bacterium]